MHRDDETLAGIALGEVSEHDDSHLETCAVCQLTLAELRDVLAVAGGGTFESLEQPPDHLWDAVRAEAFGDEAAEWMPAASAVEGESSATVLPLRDRSVPRRDVLRWLALGAAGAAAATAGAFWLGDRESRQEVAVVALETLDTKERLGTATLLAADSGGELEIETAGFDPGDGYLEVWLINRDLARMVSVGVLGSARQSFAVPQRLLDAGYVVVDISREPMDDKPAHSGVSIVRGALPI